MNKMAEEETRQPFDLEVIVIEEHLEEYENEQTEAARLRCERTLNHYAEAGVNVMNYMNEYLEIHNSIMEGDVEYLEESKWMKKKKILKSFRKNGVFS